MQRENSSGKEVHVDDDDDAFGKDEGEGGEGGSGVMVVARRFRRHKVTWPLACPTTTPTPSLGAQQAAALPPQPVEVKAVGRSKRACAVDASTASASAAATASAAEILEEGSDDDDDDDDGKECGSEDEDADAPPQPPFPRASFLPPPLLSWPSLPPARAESLPPITASMCTSARRDPLGSKSLSSNPARAYTSPVLADTDTAVTHGGLRGKSRWSEDGREDEKGEERSEEADGERRCKKQPFAKFHTKTRPSSPPLTTTPCAAHTSKHDTRDDARTGFEQALNLCYAARVGYAAAGAGGGGHCVS
eukprot:CAMPEP_0171652432 /NCGR_PEP_ID=MMETSP0990-20121206/38961_1 /TAXON_ID=483369 /ORGANISM="non described non described, Strain CCMP2098" /LENGTH=305 /DNA_ID=CAMNT_0012231671 /DNA_START=339 /DNA_END=1254 /DNA_ORIENTATION=+